MKFRRRKFPIFKTFNQFLYNYSISADDTCSGYVFNRYRDIKIFFCRSINRYWSFRAFWGVILSVKEINYYIYTWPNQKIDFFWIRPSGNIKTYWYQSESLGKKFWIHFIGLKRKFIDKFYRVKRGYRVKFIYKGYSRRVRLRAFRLKLWLGADFRHWIWLPVTRSRRILKRKKKYRLILFFFINFMQIQNFIHIFINQQLLFPYSDAGLRLLKKRKLVERRIVKK